MKRIILDGNALTDKRVTHDLLKKEFQLPEYYGENLDALWDCLSTDFSKRMIIIKNPQKITENLGRYGEALLSVFKDLKKLSSTTTIVYAYDIDKSKS